MSVQKVKTKIGDKWEVCFWIGGRGSSRIRRRFDRKVDAQNFFDTFTKKQNELFDNRSAIDNPEDVTFEKEAIFWLSNSQMRFTSSHNKRVTGILNVLLPEMGKITIDKIGPTFLTSFQQKMLDKGLKGASVNRYTEVITAIINHSYRHRRIAYNPTMGFKKFPPSNIEMKFWEKHEAASFLNFANLKYPNDSEYRWVYIVYLLALNTALRAGEIWGLKVCDLVEDGKTLFIRRQYNRVTKSFDLLKGKKNSKKGKSSRHVPCNTALRTELKLLIQKARLNSDQTFFRGKTGNPFCHDAFSERFERDQKQWGGKMIRFHDMRHTAITLLISLGVDLKTVQEICGHEDISTTMGYTHLIGESIKRVADVFSIGPIGPEKSNPEAPKLMLVANDF